MGDSLLRTAGEVWVTEEMPENCGVHSAGTVGWQLDCGHHLELWTLASESQVLWSSLHCWGDKVLLPMGPEETSSFISMCPVTPGRPGAITGAKLLGLETGGASQP